MRKYLLSALFMIGLLFICIPSTSAQTLNKQDVIESDLILQSQNQILVQYKNGYTPQEIQEKIKKRESVASQPILGSLRIAAEDTILSAQGIPQPETVQREYENANKKARLRSSRKLLREMPKRETKLKNAEVITLEPGASVANAIETYNELPTVEHAEENQLFYADIIPNDPLYAQEWGLSKIGAPLAWDKSTGNNQIIVGVVDSGVMETHPDLQANLIGGYDFVVGDNVPNDRCGHGTHVSGTIGAVTNNGIGIAGVNWNVKIVSAKSLSTAQDPSTGNPTCAGSTKTIADGIIYVTDQGAKVINMSLGGNGACSSTTQQAINYARNKGVVVIVAAGNNNQSASLHTPANCSGVIVVGATTPSDTRANFSNYGSIVSISAPGTSIMSTMSQENIMGATCAGQQYCQANGTSMATPHVSGAAALLLSISPNLTPDQIKNVLVSSADTISTNQPIGPRLNLAQAVQQVSGSSSTHTPTITQPTITATIAPQPCDPDNTGASQGIIDFADLRLIRRELAGVINSNNGACLTSSAQTSFADLRRARRIIAGLENR